MRGVIEDAASQLGKEINFRQAKEKLDSLQEFLIVVVGEWNRGKSTLVNKMLACDYQQTGNKATTTGITSFKHGADASVTSKNNVTYIKIDNPWLKCLGASIVDTPGCNSIVEEHDTVSKKYLPMADVVLFVMSIDQPLSGSERQMLEQLLNMKKHIVYVINKSDYKTKDEINEIKQQVSEDLFKLLLERGQAPTSMTDIPIFITSCKTSDTNITDLRSYLSNHLCASTRTELKLKSLVSCIQSCVDKCMALCHEEDNRLLPIMKAQFENNNQYETLEQELLVMKNEIVKHVIEETEIMRERGRDELTNTKQLELLIILRPNKVIDSVRKSEGEPAVQHSLLKLDTQVRDSLYKFQDHSRSRLVKTSELPEDTDMQMCGARYRGFIPDETSRAAFAEHVQPPMTKVIQKVTSGYPLSFPLTTPKKLVAAGGCAASALTVTGNPLAAVLACCVSLSVLPFSMKNSCLSHYDSLTSKILREMESETAACWDRNVLDTLDTINVRYSAFYTALKGESENNDRRKRYLSDISDSIVHQKNEATTKLRKIKNDYSDLPPNGVDDSVKEG
eukprot:TRINITY_DN4125_c0_g1_i1.p1 TRINITY_DN4125_c0_g1~~TRINITY_DN4125_c0_g1_i1.p1  ORF type:complete len:604 (+),score=127.83 TRINITY_DN4125_c0_g1_i1:122-1813(+)